MFPSEGWDGWTGDEMTFADILTLLGSYAFPIVMCIAFFWKMDKDQQAHKEEMDKMTEALHNNTLAIQHLSDTVKRGD